ncbi:hypothetical protein ABIF27_008221 [Bradyrhizobium elkanii]
MALPFSAKVIREVEKRAGNPLASPAICGHKITIRNET